MHKVMIQELEEKYEVGEEVNLDGLDKFEVEKLREIHRVIYNNKYNL
jgi:copper(I)-binding protein